MVAEGGVVIADFVHDVDQIFALGQGADHVALHGVAAVDQRNIVVGGLHGFFIGCQTCVADVVVDRAVDVVRVEHDDVVGLRVRRQGHGGHHAEHHADCQQDCYKFLHITLLKITCLRRIL